MSLSVPEQQNAGMLLSPKATLERATLTMRESIPNVFALFAIAPFLYAPSLITFFLRAPADCAAAGTCVTHMHAGLWAIQAIAGADRIPAPLLDAPVLADLLLGVMLSLALVAFGSLFGLPLFRGFSAALDVTKRVRPRTGEGYDFQIRNKGRAHLLSVHVQGTYTGYPGDAFISIKLDLPDALPLEVEPLLKASSGGSSSNGLSEYVYEPVYFQFTPTHNGPTHLWVAYGTGPEGKLRVAVQRRS